VALRFRLIDRPDQVLRHHHTFRPEDHDRQERNRARWEISTEIGCHVPLALGAKDDITGTHQVPVYRPLERRPHQPINPDLGTITDIAQLKRQNAARHLLETGSRCVARRDGADISESDGHRKIL
jgi:hypothetical protein